MTQQFDRLVQTFPRDLVLDLQLMADEAFAEAKSLTDRFIEDPESLNMLGQIRHARMEAGLRTVASKHGFDFGAPHTSPKGGRYSVLRAKGLTLIRGNVQAHRGPPRPSKFRKQLAETNRWLSPTQPDFYHEVPDPSDDHLCAILIVANSQKTDPSVPDWVGIGFPHHDLKSWASLRSLSSILSLYHDADSDIGALKRVSVEIRDAAYPKLKSGGKHGH